MMLDVDCNKRFQLFNNQDVQPRSVAIEGEDHCNGGIQITIKDANGNTTGQSANIFPPGGVVVLNIPPKHLVEVFCDGNGTGCKVGASILS